MADNEPKYKIPTNVKLLDLTNGADIEVVISTKSSYNTEDSTQKKKEGNISPKFRTEKY